MQPAPGPIIAIKLTGYIVCPKIYLFIYVTCGDDVTSRDNYIMMSKQPPSWIHHLGFQNFSKTSEKKITEKYSKSTIRQCKKILKEVKIVELKLIFINGNTKITNLKKHACQNDVAMVTSISRHNIISYQFIPR